MIFQSYVSMLYFIFESMTAIFVWRALRNFAMVDFEENVEEMVGTTREATAVATESGGEKMASRLGMRPAIPGMRPATRRRRRLVTRRRRLVG